LSGDGTSVTNCVFHNNGTSGTGDGFQIDATSPTILFNTIDGNDDNGVSFMIFGRGLGTMLYNRITNNGLYGIALADNTCVFGDYNGWYNNTSGEVSLTGDAKYFGGDNDVSMAGDGYNASASDDFTLAAAAELVRTSSPIGITIGTPTQLNYGTAGALTPDAASGGGRRPRAQYIRG
jgi:hypothetical protein